MCSGRQLVLLILLRRCLLLRLSGRLFDVDLWGRLDAGSGVPVFAMRSGLGTGMEGC